LDRYSYVGNSPIKYSDPTGHRECDRVDSTGGCRRAPRKIAILACGDGMGANCVGDDYSRYGNRKPLSGFAEWAKENGYDVVYFGADQYKNEDGENSVEVYANAINNYMSGHPDDQFLLIGHSRGAAAVIWAADNFVGNKENDPKRISGIIDLDASLRSDDSRHDTQKGIDNLLSKGVQVSSYNSLQYKYYDTVGTVDLPNGSQTSLNAYTHFDLANDNIFWVTWDQMLFRQWQIPPSWLK
jgi:hypothetical protein